MSQRIKNPMKGDDDIDVNFETDDGGGIALPVFIAIIAGIVALIIIIVVVIMVHLGNVADEEAATQKAKDEAAAVDLATLTAAIAKQCRCEDHNDLSQCDHDQGATTACRVQSDSCTLKGEAKLTGTALVRYGPWAGKNEDSTCKTVPGGSTSCLGDDAGQPWAYCQDIVGLPLCGSSTAPFDCSGEATATQSLDNDTPCTSTHHTVKGAACTAADCCEDPRDTCPESTNCAAEVTNTKARDAGFRCATTACATSECCEPPTMAAASAFTDYSTPTCNGRQWTSTKAACEECINSACEACDADAGCTGIYVPALIAPSTQQASTGKNLKPEWEIFGESCGKKLKSGQNTQTENTYCQAHTIHGSVTLSLCSGVPTYDADHHGSNGAKSCSWTSGTEVRYILAENQIAPELSIDTPLCANGEQATDASPCYTKQMESTTVGLHPSGPTRFYSLRAITVTPGDPTLNDEEALVVKFRVAEDKCKKRSSGNQACTIKSKTANYFDNPDGGSDVLALHTGYADSISAGDVDLGAPDKGSWHKLENLFDSVVGEYWMSMQIGTLKATATTADDAIVLTTDFGADDYATVFSSTIHYNEDHTAGPKVSNACGVYSLTARRFTRHPTAATGTTANTYTPIEIKSSTLDATTIHVDPATMPGAVDPFRPSDFWQFEAPVQAQSLRFTCGLGEPAGDYMDGFDGLTAVQKPVQADHVVIERWYLYTAKSSWTADLPSGGSHHVTVEDLYTCVGDADEDTQIATFGDRNGDGTITEGECTANGGTWGRGSCGAQQVKDCADACAAVGLIGDGVCDDGTAGKGNFNCAKFMYDEMDCSW